MFFPNRAIIPRSNPTCDTWPPLFMCRIHIATNLSIIRGWFLFSVTSFITPLWVEEAVTFVSSWKWMFAWAFFIDEFLLEHVLGISCSLGIYSSMGEVSQVIWALELSEMLQKFIDFGLFKNELQLRNIGVLRTFFRLFRCIMPWCREPLIMYYYTSIPTFKDLNNCNQILWLLLTAIVS